MAAKGIFVFVSLCLLAFAFGKPQNQGSLKGNLCRAVTPYITVTWPFPKGDRCIQPCVVGGQTIQPGAQFYMDCSGFCRCGSGPIFSCVPLCPLDNYHCSPNTKAQFEDMIVETGSKLCRCPRFVGCY